MTSRSSHPKRQAIFILTDTQRPDMLGCYGGKGMHTPNLDAFAAEGLRLDKAYCVSPVCVPSRSALFTGQYPHTNGSWSNEMPLNKKTRTLGQRLQDANVSTAYVGKWHLDGHDYFGAGVCPPGWDPEYWYDMRCYLDELTPEERLKSRQPETNHREDIAREFTFAHRCTERALDFLRKHRDEDFFLVISYDEPHHPWITPREFFGLSQPDQFFEAPSRKDPLDGKPSHHRIWAEKASKLDEQREREFFEHILASNAFVDHEIGRLLKEIGISCPDALTMYTSDHGDMFGGHRLQGKGPVMYEEITHIPWLVRWPEVVGKGTTCSQPVSQIDLTPTILDYFDVPLAPALQGASLLDTFRKPELQVPKPVFMEFGRFEVDHDGFGGFEPIRCVYDGRYKLVLNLLDTDELYDLSTDPEEQKNLILSEEDCETRNRLHDVILEWMDRTRDPFRGHYWVNRPWRKDAPRPTWDNSGMTRQMASESNEKEPLDYETGLAAKPLTRRKAAPVDDIRNTESLGTAN